MNSKLINLLNRQFNREVNTLLRYLIEAASMRGPEDSVVRSLYLKEIGEKVDHAQSLADQIVALGATPHLHPASACPPVSVREMLRHDAAEEKTEEQNYLRLASEAEKEELVELKRKLEAQAGVEHHYRYELECLLW